MPRVVNHPLLKEPMVFPTGTPDMEIYNALYQKVFAVPEMGAPPKEEAGFTGSFKEGLGTLGGLPEAVGYLGRPTAETRRAAAEAGESEYEYKRLADIGGLGDLGRYAKELAGGSLGFMGAPLAASATAARVMPGPAVVKGAAGIGAFLTTAASQYLTNTATRQAAEQEKSIKEGKAPELPDATKVALTSLGQAGLDVAGFRLFRPLGEMVGLAGKKTAREEAEEVAKAFAKDPIEGAKRVLGGEQGVKKAIALGAGIEGAQEVAQQALERFGAGLDLGSDEAISEYIEAAVGGGLLGGPLGGVSAYAGNARRGIYDKDFLQQTADAVQGKKINLGQEWDNYSKQIYIDAPTFNLTDEQGNFVPYTPDLLERMGIDPTAKAINVGGRGQNRVSINMEDVFKADTGNVEIGKALLSMFRIEKVRLSKEIENNAKQMEVDELAQKVKEYENTVAGLKTFEAFFDPGKSINSPTNFVVQPSPTDPKKFVVFNPVTGKNAVDRNFSSAENAQKYIDSQVAKPVSPDTLTPGDLEIQPDPVKAGVFTVFNKKTSKYDTKKEFKSEAEAQEYINTKLGIPVKPTAPTAPTETPEDIAARRAKEVRDQLYKDLAGRYPQNPDAVKEITQMAEDLEVTMPLAEALAQAETTYLQDQEAAQPPATPPAPSKVKQEEDVLDFNNLEASLEGYLDPETEGMRQNYVYSNQSKNEYAKAAEENEAYQDALQQNLAGLPDTVTMYRGRDKTKRYLDSIGPYLNVTTNKNIARNFAKTTKTNPENWVVESYEVPKSAIVALGHTEEREFLVNMNKGVQQITHLQKPMYEEEATIEGEVKEKPKALPSTKPKAPRARKAPTGQPYEKYTAQMREMLAGVDPESGLAEDLNEFINLAEESKDTTIAKELSQLAQTYAQATRDSVNPKLSQTEQDNATQRATNIFSMLGELRDQAMPKNAAEMKAAKDATGNAETANKVAAKVTKDICG